MDGALPSPGAGPTTQEPLDFEQYRDQGHGAGDGL